MALFFLPKALRLPTSPGLWVWTSRVRRRILKHMQTIKASSSSLQTSAGFGGIAIIITTFIVALATMVVVNVTHSTFLTGRSVGMVERQLQAEYALKSLVNIAATIIMNDQSPNVDGQEDVWGMFSTGGMVPKEIAQSLGYTDPGMELYLEITPENGKIPLDRVSNPGMTQSGLHDRWKNAYERLFIKLGFDEKSLSEGDQTGRFGDRVFSSKELVENLVTYMRTDLKEESQMPTGHGPIRRVGELINIPGFTARRISRLEPFVTAKGPRDVNINVAKPWVLEALHADLDASTVEGIINQRETKGPFNNIQELTELNLISDDTLHDLISMISVRSSWFQIIAKIEYGGGLSYFMRAYAIKEESGVPSGTQPRILYPQIF